MRLLAGLGAILAGGLTGVCAVAVHHWWWGLLLTGAAVLATLLAVGPGWSARLPFAVALATTVGMLALRRDEGDYVVAADTPGYVLLGVALAAVVLAVATLPRPARTRDGKPSAPPYTGPR